MDSRSHWEKIYGEKAPNAVSWYRPHLETSLSLIERVASRDSAIIDVGGGESTLVDDLLSHEYKNVTVLDVSQTAIDANTTRLGKASERVHWLVADITKAELAQSAYDVWHDRAVFHFRHALATALVKLRVDAKTVQGMLRHEDFGTTMQLYAQSDMESMREAQGKFLEQLLGDRIHLLTERVQ